MIVNRSIITKQRAESESIYYILFTPRSYIRTKMFCRSLVLHEVVEEAVEVLLEALEQRA